MGESAGDHGVECRRERMDLREMGVWGTQTRVEFGDRYEDVWVQIIGDRAEALERGHEAMQRKLLEFRPGSDRAAAMTEALKLAPREDVADLVVRAEMPQMEARLRREVPDPVTPRQDGAARESAEAFAQRVREHRLRCEELGRQREARVAEALEARRGELLSMEREELAELARPRRIDTECWNAFAQACDDWVLLRAVRSASDHDRAYFDEIGEVRALHPDVKQQLRRAYRELEPQEGDALPKASAASPASA